MNTMTLITTAPSTENLMAVSDAELEAWFADAGLSVSVVLHCDSAACTICFPADAPAKAA